MGFGADPGAEGRRDIEAAVRLDEAPVPRAGWDLALAHLRGPPAAAAPLLLGAASRLAAGLPRTVRLVGFGHGGAAGNDEHRRRSGAGVLTAMQERELFLLPGPALPCAGDSGGPVLAEDGDGEAVVGVIVGGDARCTGRATAVRLDAQADFLAAYLTPPAPGCSVAGAGPAGHLESLAPLGLLLLLLPAATRRFVPIFGRWQPPATWNGR